MRIGEEETCPEEPEDQTYDINELEEYEVGR